MSVRNAIAKRDQAAVEKAAKPSQAAIVRQAIERQSSAFRQVLPRHVDPERFARLTLSAVKATPELMRCFETPAGETSVLLAAMQAAAVGLEPQTPTQECWLLPRRNQGRWECQLYVGYRGYLKLSRRSGNVKTVVADVVHEKDHFHWARGLEADVLEHVPHDDDDAGELTHAYCIVRYVNGGYNYVVLNRRQVEARRAMSDSWRNEKARSYSPWTRWPESQWRKTAIRAAAPFLDLTPEAETVVAADEHRLDFDDEAGVMNISEVVAGELDQPDAETDGKTDGEPPKEWPPGEEPFEGGAS